MSTTKTSRPGRRAPLDPERLWKRRALKGLSQQELAEASGLSTTHISRLEVGNGGVSASALAALARALDCEITDLMPGESADTPPADVDVQRVRDEERAVPHKLPDLRR